MSLTQVQLDADIASIEIFHARLGLQLAKSLAYHSVGMYYLESFLIKNRLVSKYKRLLQAYNIVGDAEACALVNWLTNDDIKNIINDCYRQLDEYVV